MEHVTLTPFWTRRRLLRGALTPAQAVILGAFATAVLLWAHLILARTEISPYVIPGETSGLLPLWFMADVPGILLVCEALVIAPLAVAAFVDSVCHLLPDPLLLLAGLAAMLSIASYAPRKEWEVITGGVLTAVLALAVGLVLSSMLSFGRGDAKLLGVMGLWLGSPTSLLVTVIMALVGAGLYAATLMVLRKATRTTALALGPWLVGGAAAMWAIGI